MVAIDPERSYFHVVTVPSLAALGTGFPVTRSSEGPRIADSERTSSTFAYFFRHGVAGHFESSECSHSVL